MVCAMLFALCTPAHPQHAKVHKLGFLSASSQSSFVTPGIRAFLQELRTLGYVQGKNILIEYRAAEGKYDRLPDLAAELIGLNVDVIVANSALAARPAKAGTKTIPIVAYSGDLVGAGLVSSLARPGGNVTGVTDLSPDLSGKRFELLKDIIPGLVRVGVLGLGRPGPAPCVQRDSGGCQGYGITNSVPRSERSEAGF